MRSQPSAIHIQILASLQDRAFLHQAIQHVKQAFCGAHNLIDLLHVKVFDLSFEEFHGSQSKSQRKFAFRDFNCVSHFEPSFQKCAQEHAGPWALCF